MAEFNEEHIWLLQSGVYTKEGLLESIFNTVPNIVINEVHDPVYLGLDTNTGEVHTIYLGEYDIGKDYSVLNGIHRYADTHSISVGAIVCEVVWDNSNDSSIVVHLEDRFDGHEVYMAPIIVQSDGGGSRYLGEMELSERDFGWRLFDRPMN